MEMKKITVVVEFAKGNLSAYIKEVDGITAAAQTMQELKRSKMKAYRFTKKNVKSVRLTCPRL